MSKAVSLGSNLIRLFSLDDMIQVLTHRWRTINQLAARPACSKNSIVDAKVLCVCVQTMRLRRQRFSVFMRKDDTVGFLVEGILYQQSFGPFEPFAIYD